MPWEFWIALAATAIGGWEIGRWLARRWRQRCLARVAILEARRRAELEALARARATITRACEARSYAAKARN